MNVTYVQFHHVPFIPVIGRLETSIGTEGTLPAKYKGIKMSVEGMFIRIQLRGRELYVPLSNVAHFEVGKNETENDNQEGSGQPTSGPVGAGRVSALTK